MLYAKVKTDLEAEFLDAADMDTGGMLDALL